MPTLDDIYRRLDPQAQQSITGQVSTTNARGTTTTSNQQANTTPNKQDVKAAVKLGRAQDAGYDLTQAANASAITGAPQGSGSSLAPVASNLGAGGRSRYTDEQIAFMTGGGTTTNPPPTTTNPPVNPPNNPGTPTEPVDPNQPGSAEGGAIAGTLGGYTEAEIDAALKGLEAQFGMTREQLMADQSMIGAQYRLLLSRLNRQRTQSIGAATNDAVSRGIYRSGILGENIAGLESQFAEQEQGARQAQMTQEQNIQRQLDFLEQAKQAAMAQAENQILGQAAGYMTQAGVGPAEAGFGAVGGAPAGGAPGTIAPSTPNAGAITGQPYSPPAQPGYNPLGVPSGNPAMDPASQSALLRYLQEQQRIVQGDPRTGY